MHLLFVYVSLLPSKKIILVVSKISLFLFPSKYLAMYVCVCIILNYNNLFHREQVNKILCIFFDKVDQYRTCIQSNNSKMVGVAEYHV